MIKLLADTAGMLAPNSRSRILRRLVHKEELRVSKPLRSALPFLALSICIGMFSILLALYTPCYTLTLEGNTVGHVRNHQVVEQTAQQVEEQIGLILGRDYSLDLEMNYRVAMTSKENLLSYTHLSEAMYSAVPDIKQAYVLTVDGEYLGAAQEKTVLDGALQEIRNQYVKENTKEVFFANEARITKKYIPADGAFLDGASFLQAMTQTITAPTAYEVKKGDTLRSLAKTFGMTTQALRDNNPTIKATNALTAGQMITVEKTVPRLSVCTVDRVNYTKSIASPVREVKDSSLYEGDSQIIIQGVEGTERVISNVTQFNGETLYEEIQSQQVLTQPTETVMAVGTKERPVYYSTGSLQWPCSGKITSPFGYRYLFGSSSFHSGLDIANAYGTSIVAADSGVVTYVGYKGSYGNLIIIDHGNGWETYYSHSSQNLVSVGDGVKKGTLIAKMGSTGRATGNHCHFEFHINGEAVNPQIYLP